MAEKTSHRNTWIIGLVIAAGLGLSMLSAVQPYYSAYRLDVGLLVAGVAPYVILGGLAFYLRDGLMAGAGVLVVLIHLLAAAYAGADTLLYWLPPVLALALLARLPQAARAARFPRREQPKGEDTPDLTEP